MQRNYKDFVPVGQRLKRFSVQTILRIMEFLKSKIYDPFVNLFRSGMDRKVLSLSIAVGLVSGIFPVPGLNNLQTLRSRVSIRFLGTTSLVCIALCMLLKCNIPAAQLINLIVTPIELFMFIPFIRLGDFALGQSLPGTFTIHEECLLAYM